MYSFLLNVAYDGTDYHGWIIQKHSKTIQGELYKAIKLISKSDDFMIAGASKTDAQVHALSQKVIVKLNYDVNDLTRFVTAINKALPLAIKITNIKKVDDTFNLYNVISKSYCYTINDDKFDLFNHRYELQWLYGKLDIDILQTLFNLFVGTHNFFLFSGLNKEEAKSINPIRTIDSNYVSRDKTNKIKIIFKGKGFIRYQIRMIVGAVLACYQNRHITVQDIQDKLNNIGEKSTMVAPPHGLCLEDVIL